MNDAELDRLVAQTMSVTDAEVDSWDLEYGEVTLLEEIMSIEPRNKTRYRRRVLVAVSVAAAALVVGSFMGSSSVAPTSVVWAAEPTSPNASQVDEITTKCNADVSEVNATRFASEAQALGAELVPAVIDFRAGVGTAMYTFAEHAVVCTSFPDGSVKSQYFAAGKGLSHTIATSITINKNGENRVLVVGWLGSKEDMTEYVKIAYTDTSGRFDNVTATISNRVFAAWAPVLAPFTVKIGNSAGEQTMGPVTPVEAATTEGTGNSTSATVVLNPQIP